MCGVVGIVGRSAVNQQLYDALTMLQHRGQDAAGIVTADDQHMHLRKSTGLVSNVFRQEHMERLRGCLGIGHVRYPTAGASSSPSEAQPMYVNSPYGIALAHNGNLINAARLKRELFATDLRHINTESDSEILLNVFAHGLRRSGKLAPGAEDIFAAVRRVHERCQGAYSAVALVMGLGVVAFRDPFGIRPLVFGRRDSDAGPEYMVASESVALDLLGFEIERDVAPGEAIFIDTEGRLHTEICADDTLHTPCIFEHVYLARPDSIIDGISVYKARLRMGEKLAERILARYPGGRHDIDVVIPIPDTARTAALPLAYELGVKYREGFVKNRYIARTFIMPGQNERADSVRKKFNLIPLEFAGKNVLLLDDSVVRGTTTFKLVQMARAAGARKVYVASAAPEVRFPNVYGIDMPSRDELIASGRSADEVARRLGADWIVYQDLGDLVDCAREGNPSITRFECSVFDGHYVAGDVSEEYLAELSVKRSDAAKSARALAGEATVLELHNHS